MPMPAWGGGERGRAGTRPPRQRRTAPTRCPQPHACPTARPHRLPSGGGTAPGGGGGPRHGSAAPLQHACSGRAALRCCDSPAVQRVQSACGDRAVAAPCGGCAAATQRRAMLAPCHRGGPAAPQPRRVPAVPRSAHVGAMLAAGRATPVMPAPPHAPPRSAHAWPCRGRAGSVLKQPTCPNPGGQRSPEGGGHGPVCGGGGGTAQPRSPPRWGPRAPRPLRLSPSRVAVARPMCCAHWGGGAAPSPRPLNPLPSPPQHIPHGSGAAPAEGGGGGARRDPPVLCIEPPSPRWGGRGGERLNVRRGGVRGEGGGGPGGRC